jgi:cytidine deaminase
MIASSIKLSAVGTRELYERAIETQKNSYSPYSRYKVGVALRISNGAIYRGCNFENSSFPVGTCAERTAIGSAISENGKIQIMEMVIVTQSTPPGAPCGLCRQAIAEFAEPTALIHVANAAGDVQTFTLGELLPFAFNSADLTS